MTVTVTIVVDVGRPLLVLRQLDRLHGLLEVAGRGGRRPDQGHAARRHRPVHPGLVQAGREHDRQENPNYWRKVEDLPYLDEIDFRVIPDELTAANALKSGEIDVLHHRQRPEHQGVQGRQAVQLLGRRTSTRDTFYLMLNVGQAGLAAAGPERALRPRRGHRLQDADRTCIDGRPVPGGQRSVLARPAGLPRRHRATRSTTRPRPRSSSRPGPTPNGGKKPQIILSTTTDATTQQQAAAPAAVVERRRRRRRGAGGRAVEADHQRPLGDPSFNAFSWRNHAGTSSTTRRLVELGQRPASGPAGAELRPHEGPGHRPSPARRPAPTRTRPRRRRRPRTSTSEFAKQCWMIPTTGTSGASSRPAKVQGIGNSATLPDGTTAPCGTATGKSPVQVQLSTSLGQASRRP